MQIPLIGKAPYFAHRKDAEGLFQYALYAAPHPAIAQPVQPLTDKQVQTILNTKHYHESYVLQESDKVCFEWYRLGLRNGEEAHGIVK